jgi:integrase
MTVLLDAAGAPMLAGDPVLWRAGPRIHEALALAEHDLDARRGSLLVRHGKGGRRREVAMDEWAGSSCDRGWTRGRGCRLGRCLHRGRRDPRTAVIPRNHHDRAHTPPADDVGQRRASALKQTRAAGASPTASARPWRSECRSGTGPDSCWSSAAGAPRTWTRALASDRMRARERGAVSSPGPVDALPDRRAASGESRD